MSLGANKKNAGTNHPWPPEKKRTGAAATGKVRGIALKAAGAALHAELRAAANTERRTANAAMRDMDCIMTTTPECVAEHFSNGLGVVVGGNDEGHKWSKRHAGCSALESTRESGVGAALRPPSIT